MTDQTLSTHEQLDVLASEYVLGLHEGGRSLALDARYERDSVFASLVDYWREQFSDLDDQFEAVLPPASLKAELDSALDEVTFQSPAPQIVFQRPKPAFWKQLSVWRGLTLASFAALASIVGINAFQRFSASKVPGSEFVAVLDVPASETSQSAQVLAVIPASYPSEPINVTFLKGSDPAAADFELWAISGEGTPTSLGLLEDLAQTSSDDSSRSDLYIQEAMILAISLEPEGGSTQAGPTGAVLATSELKAL